MSGSKVAYAVLHDADEDNIPLDHETRVYGWGKCVGVVVPRSAADIPVSQPRRAIGRREALLEIYKRTPTDSEIMKIEQLGRHLLHEVFDRKNPQMLYVGTHTQSQKFFILQRVSGTEWWAFDAITFRAKQELHLDTGSLRDVANKICDRVGAERVKLKELPPDACLPRLPQYTERVRRLKEMFAAATRPTVAA